MNWRRLFPIIFLFSCIDGFISSLFYPARLPFLYKDILILIVYILFFITREPGKQWIGEFKRRVGYGTWYLAISLIFLGGLQMFNPHIPRLEIGILGFKTMFFYWPLAILGYAYVDSLDSVIGLLKKIVYFSIPLCIFGLYQFWQPMDFMANTFGSGFRRSVVIAGGGQTELFLRVFSTFASPGQFTSFLVTNIMFMLGLLFSTTNKFEKIIYTGCLILNYVTLLATGSRGGLLFLFPIILLFVICCRWLWRTFFIIFLLAVSLSFGFDYLGKSVFLRFQSIRDIEMLKTRTVKLTSRLFNEHLEKYPFGLGMGVGTTASRHLMGEGETGTYFIENYPTKLQIEMGIAGVILFYLLVLKLIIHWIRHWLKLKERKAFVILVALSSYCWGNLVLSSLFGVIDSPPIGIFLWTEIGIAAKLVALHSDDKYSLST